MRSPGTCIVVGLLVAGCAGQATGPPQTPVTHIPERGGWFCQMDPSGSGWECVRDPELAEDPVPARLPQAATPSSRETGRRSPDLPDGEEPAEERPDGEPPVVEPEPLPDGGSRPAPEAADSSPPEAEPSVPEYARLAFQPERPVALTELPPQFYAVQVIALSSRGELEDFVRRHGLHGASAAAVERQGELYYVLLLGIYETGDAARRAVDSLPPGLAGITPWVRPLGSLQAAMRRAETLTGPSS